MLNTGLYMFLLSISFALLLIQVKSQSDRFLQSGDIILGICLFALTITRAVGRYLFIPVGILFVLSTRNWRRGLVLAFSIGITSFLFSTVYDAFLESLETAAGNNSQLSAEQKIENVSNLMLLTPLRKRLLNADDGPASAQLVEILQTCSDAAPGTGIECIVQEAGGFKPADRLIAKAFPEMFRARPLAYAELIFDEFNAFLEMSGQQYYDIGMIVSDIQCEDIDTIVEGVVDYYVSKDWALAVERGQLDKDTFTSVVQDFARKMCPPLPDNEGIRSIVDNISFQYRLLSRPHAIIWYAILIILVVGIPWARRLWFPVFAGAAFLVNHAAISAIVFNVQPRYAAVTNPYKGILLLTLLFILGQVALRILDEWLRTRTTHL